MKKAKKQERKKIVRNNRKDTKSEKRVTRMCQNQLWRFSRTGRRRPGRAKQRDFYAHSTWTGSSNYMNKLNIKRTIKA